MTARQSAFWLFSVSLAACSPFEGGSSAPLTRERTQPVLSAGRHPDAEDARFSLAVLPDTQYLFDGDRADPEPVFAALRYLLHARGSVEGARTIAFLTQLGDVTENASADEMSLASRAFEQLDGRLSYSVLAGNHDVPGGGDDQRGPTPFLAAFGPQRFRNDPTFGGASPDGYNRFHVFTGTIDGAPLEGMRFESGFTIEAFLKIAADYDAGGHAWMGALSWMGKSGDAGKTGGDPEEPVASLNVSPERFLQWIAYPTDRVDSSTHWSHAIPAAHWVHVAIVNDGSRSIVYVEGSPIARNPRSLATGISTLGTPFVIGGTQYAGLFEQSFHGAIGDVRVVDRALASHELMNAPDAAP